MQLKTGRFLWFEVMVYFVVNDVWTDVEQEQICGDHVMTSGVSSGDNTAKHFLITH